MVASFGKLYLDAGGLMQSGPFLVRIWGNAFKKLRLNQNQYNSILVLGLGGGSFVQLARQLFQGTKITAVDIDPVMVETGKKYLSLNDSSIEIVIADAQKFAHESLKKNRRYDLIFVDLYHGYELPGFVESDLFLLTLMKLLNSDGNIVFNRLYFREYKNLSDQFFEKLTKKFPTVRSVRSYSNLIISTCL